MAIVRHHLSQVQDMTRLFSTPRTVTFKTETKWTQEHLSYKKGYKLQAEP